MSPAHRTAFFVALLAIYIASPAPAQKLLPDGIKDLATQIATGVAKEQKQKIAVLPFRELDGRATVLGTYISEQLVTDLFAAGVLDIVERAMLDKLIGEIRLGQNGVIDPETAKKLGKVAGVDAIVTGSITDLQTYVALNCRLIDAQTGRIFGAAQTRIVKDDDVRKIMGAALPSAPSGSTETQTGQEQAGASSKPPQPAAAQRKEASGFLFELKACTLSGTSVTCDLLVTNKGEDRWLQLFSGNNRWESDVPTRLITEDGSECFAESVSLGGDGGRSSKTLLASEVPTRVRYKFGKVTPEAQKATLLQISGSVEDSNSSSRRVTVRGGDSLSIQFRNVPLVRP